MLHFMYHGLNKYSSRLKTKLFFSGSRGDFPGLSLPVCTEVPKQCDVACFSLERISKHTIPLVIISNKMSNNL